MYRHNRKKRALTNTDIFTKMGKIRASIAQCCTSSYDTPATLEKMRRLVKLAKERDDSQLVVFPEAFIGGPLIPSSSFSLCSLPDYAICR